jgi:putative endonuclease
MFLIKEAETLARELNSRLYFAGLEPSVPMKQPCVYLMASRRNGTLYIGVTSDLIQRVWQHKNDVVEGFTKRYRVHKLVWYDVCDSMAAAIARERRSRNGSARGKFG